MVWLEFLDLMNWQGCTVSYIPSTVFKCQVLVEFDAKRAETMAGVYE